MKSPYRFSCRVLLGALWAFALLLPAPAFANGGIGASVDEAAVRLVFTVDQTAGRDANPGTAARPVQTIGRGFALAGAMLGRKQGVKLVVRPGIYREPLRFGPPNVYSAPFILEGTDPNRCRITGSDRWTGWTQPDADGAVSKPWPYQWGSQIAMTDSEPPEMRRYENVVVDGRMYLPKLTRAALTPGTFFVDESAGRLFLKPSAGINLSDPAHDVEVTTRVGDLWDPKGNRRDASLLHFFRPIPAQRTVPADIVVRGLTFENSATATALMLQNITNALVENCRFRNNGYSGLGVSGNRITVRNCRFEDNGSTGFGADGDGILIQDCLTTRNCAKGHAYGWDGWDSGGFKCGGLTRSIVRRLTAQGNFTKGMWFDTACLGDLVEDCSTAGNDGDGLFWENNNRNTIPRLGDRITGRIRHCRFTNNGGAGVFLAECENLVLDGCRLTGNGDQIGMYNGTDPPRGVLHNISFQHCILAAETAQQALLGIDINHPAPSWPDQFLPGLRLDALYNTDHNQYYSPRPTPFRDGSGKETLTFAAWQAFQATRGHADQHSVWLTSARSK